jgi:P4 family phage/plasmid primase-like protien
MTDKAKDLAASMAERLLKDNHFATLNGTEEVLVYKDGVYSEGGETYIKRLVQHNLQASEVTRQLVSEVIGHVQRSTYVKHSDFFTESPCLVVQNGLLNTETGKLESHSPDFFSLSRLPVQFVPEQDCPTFKKFLTEVLYPEDIRVVQEWIGYCLHRGYPAQVAILFVGEGNNGKSTLISAIQALLGRDNVSAVSLQELEVNRFAKADLFGKLANLYADLPDSALKSVGTFKMLTGGDPIRGERKFQNSFLFVNSAKLTFSCNVVPEVYEDTTAFFRRWIIIQFPNTFDGTKADKDLLKKLTTPEELSGILNFALAGLARLRTNGWRFSISRSTEEVRQDYIRRSSPIRAFLMDAVVMKSTGVVSKRDFFAAFVKYCTKMKLAVVTDQTFFRNFPIYFAKNPLQESREDLGGSGKRVPCYRGIQLRKEENWGQTTAEEEQRQSEEAQGKPG